MLIRSSFLGKPNVGFGYGRGMVHAAQDYNVIDPYNPAGIRFSKDHKPSIEHIIPRGQGGGNEEDNLIPADTVINNQIIMDLPKPQVYKENPHIVKQMPQMINEMEKIETENFDGKTWAPKVRKRLYQVDPQHFLQCQSIG